MPPPAPAAAHEPSSSLAALAVRSAGEPSDDLLSEGILDAALVQFRLLGIRRSSIEDVARRAKVGRVTVFRKFGSKDGLVQALVLREARLLIERADAAVAPLETIEEKLVEGFLLCFNAARRHPLLTGLLETEPETILPLLTVAGAPAIELGGTVIARQVAPSQRPGDSARVGELLTRIGLSLLLTPSTAFSLSSDEDIRAFARRYLVPIALPRR
jgi:AcrR family transcriptional regulator